MIQIVNYEWTVCDGLFETMELIFIELMTVQLYLNRIQVCKGRLKVAIPIRDALFIGQILVGIQTHEKNKKKKMRKLQTDPTKPFVIIKFIWKNENLYTMKCLNCFLLLSTIM